MNAEKRISELLAIHFNGSPSDAERAELMDLLAENQHEPAVQQMLKDAWVALSSEHDIFSSPERNTIIDNILESDHQSSGIILQVNRSIFSRALFRYAAAIIVIVTSATYLWHQQKSSVPTDKKNDSGAVADIKAAGQKAMLTLDDGSVITLDSSANGTLARQNNTRVLKTGAGSLAYKADETESDRILYNTVSTPRGGHYQITLSDGTKVWLNAASSIRFPTSLSGSTREITITGEVYLEVAQDAKRPFNVLTRQGSIRVLGTSFNVNAYENEADVKATLVEGSIRVENNSYTSVLTPGQQAGLGVSNNTVKEVDIDPVVAWKNGVFNFKDASLPTVMRQLERWYDIQVVYKGAVPSREFQGELPQTLSLKQVLKILTEMEVKYELKDRTITIQN